MILAWAILISFGLMAVPDTLVRNGDFEGPFQANGVAEGWQDNSGWADLDVSYARDTERAHGGRACQRITCTRLGNGAVQTLPGCGIGLKKGRIYHVAGWFRAEPPQRVAMQLRLAPAPYTVYASKDIVAAEAWAKLGFYWTSNVDDPQGRLMIRFTRTGSVWVDDVVCEEASAESAPVIAPPKGNLLANGSFELGPANWLWHHGCDYWTEPDVRVAPRPDGGHYLRLKVPDGVRVHLHSAAVVAASGCSVQASCRIRADRAASVWWGSRRAKKTAQITTDWTTLTAFEKPRFTPDELNFVGLSLAGPVEVSLDDVRLWQDGSDEIRFHAAILPDRFPLALYHDGETPRLRLLSVTPPGGKPPKVMYRVVNFWAEQVHAGAWQPRAGRDEKALAPMNLRRGWYRAEAQWKAGNKQRFHESTFVLLPPAERKAPAERSPFGAHFALGPSGVRLAKAVGVRWLRLHPPNHTKWRVVEPKKGQWAWRDQPIRIARQHGFAICGSLDRLPTWASTAPPGTPDQAFYTGTGAYVPREWREWENYVRKTVARYRGIIDVWEVWNEPNLTSWLVPRKGQTRPEAYVEMLRHTTPVVKEVNPEATVIGGCVAGAVAGKTSARKFAEAIIERGALKLMDVFSYHEYITKSVDETTDPIGSWTQRLRSKMRAAGRLLPVINSEGGFANPGTCLKHRVWDSDTVPSEQMARLLVRQYVASWAAGVERFFFYNFFIDGFPTVRRWEGFVEGEGQPRPNVAAYAAMSWLLDGASFARTEYPTKNSWVHRFETPRGLLSVAWTRTGTSARWIASDAAEAWDLMGREFSVPEDGSFRLTDAPVYVLHRRRT